MRIEAGVGYLVQRTKDSQAQVESQWPDDREVG
jgi:hypothetical protein